MLSAASWAREWDERRLKPDIDKLHQTVAEKFIDFAAKLGLTDDQRTKIREAHAACAPKYEALRKSRHELLQSEMDNLSSILTPEQREKVKDFVEDRLEKRTTTDRDWPHYAEMRDSIAEKIQAFGNTINLTEEQRKRIREAHTKFAEQYRKQWAERWDLVEQELREISALLTPEQRRMARNVVEERVVLAPMALTVAERLEAMADKLGLNTEQRQQIITAHRPFAEKYHALRSERRDLLRDELNEICSVLTSEQREKVRDFHEDRVVMDDFTPREGDREQAQKCLRETVAERLEAVADKLGLSDEQRDKIHNIHTSYVDKYKAERKERRDLRQQELKAMSAILTPEQREKTENWIEERSEMPRER